ncbi:hypothetical protein Rhe02_49340 [Rhizocola hellebori]|uniref:Pvc16 N-terminal domain-containing protein n=1 Tax=Rhizocola hellebori TaxID=1392758 RepID=A0A8J3VI21_9ACTN|nr:DUF4255 domain-containing protein [Rhizocola hellebori]GIH06867.1 hypothetical protein Rhe02_49340 [Rhizocola hellebori]
MSTALAIGAVSAVLRNVLDNGLVDAVPAVGSPVKVSAKAPDLIKLDNPSDGPQLNLFLYRVSLNQGWRNADLPSRDSGGRRTSSPPLALDLHYLLTAYGKEDLQAEMLLGYGMQLLHDRPFLDRAAIRSALQFDPLDPSATVPTAFQTPANAGLADQLETLKISWELLDLEGMSKLWSATQSHYRPSAAFQVSVVLIEPARPVVTPLPVLTRTLRVEPSTLSPYPTLESVSAPDGTPVVELGETVTLHGTHLAGTALKVLLQHRLLKVPHVITVGANADATTAKFALPATEPVNQIWPAGVWSVSVELVPEGESEPRTTKVAAMMLAPVPTVSGVALTRDPNRIHAVVPLTPSVQPEQAATIGLNSAQGPVAPHAAALPQIEADLAPIPGGPAVVRLRVDGVESRIIDTTKPAPEFRADRKVVVPS